MFPKTLRYILLICFLTIRVQADGQGDAVAVYHLQDFGGNWRLLTNLDSSVTALEKSVHRDGNQVYSRVFQLKPVAMRGAVGLGTEGDVLNFIHQYRPPPIPYTSPQRALEMGTAKFNCLEFADDIVSHAASNGIAAEVIGIKLQGKLIGHACAGFPTADGNMLYFDSTPSEGKKSHAAHQAFVELGQPYRRSDGGELGGGVGRLPISEIVPVTPLTEAAAAITTPSSPVTLSPFTTLVLQSEDHVQARGILYADENSLQVSGQQLKKWSEAIAENSEKTEQRAAAEEKVLDANATRLVARALQENERLAAEGDPYALMRMGERYLTGEAVPKDLVKGRTYLEKAAFAGSSSALAELNRLDN